MDLPSVNELILRGNQSLQKGKFFNALKYLKKAEKIDPQNAIIANNTGTALYQLGEIYKAQRAFRKAIKLEPTYVDPLYNLGLLLKEIGEIEEALCAFRRTIAVDPTHVLSHYEIGEIFVWREDSLEAVKNFQTALSLRPDFYEAWVGAGIAYKQVGEIVLAEESFRKAILINPEKADAYFLHASILKDRGKFKKAEKSLEQTLKINPKFIDAANELFLLGRDICDWSKSSEREKILDKIGGGSPLVSLIRTDNPKKNMIVAKRWCKLLNLNQTSQTIYVHNAKKDSKIRIGYFSHDFHNHSIGHLTAAMFAHHDRRKFKVFTFSYGPDDKGTCRKMIESGSDVFLDVKNMGKKEIADSIYKNKIDILVDLMGHTIGNRLEVMTLRPAPIQVTWLGFPGTLGADFVDYIIADKIVVPKKYAKFYTEKIVYLPRCYQVNNNLSLISRRKIARSDFGLPKEGVVFASFHYLHKIDSQMWRVWMNILQRVPKSVLWILAEETTVQRNLLKEAKKSGINQNRIVFALKLSKPDHLNRLKLADIALDTRIYGGHTTTSDMLWAGVPVITKIGNHFASRVCASILTEAGIPELITRSLKEYEDKAVYLANHPEELAKIRKKITQDNLKKNLYDTEGFVRDLERAYLLMWNIYSQKENPKQIEIKI